jgi:hypothetical protein
MKKGLFWLISDEHGGQKLRAFSLNCDENGVPTEPRPAYNSRKGDSFTHKNSWAMASADAPREIRSKAWNHFPRGRVEIKRGKATIYHNPSISDWAGFEAAIWAEFDLRDVIVVFIPDGSKHYRYLKED